VPECFAGRERVMSRRLMRRAKPDPIVTLTVGSTSANCVGSRACGVAIVAPKTTRPVPAQSRLPSAARADGHRQLSGADPAAVLERNRSSDSRSGTSAKPHVEASACSRSGCLLGFRQNARRRGINIRGELLPVQRIHAYLVHPKKGDEDSSQPHGTDVPLLGQMFNLMDAIYSFINISSFMGVKTTRCIWCPDRAGDSDSRAGCRIQFRAICRIHGSSG
jgi:hypothetical protein